MPSPAIDITDTKHPAVRAFSRVSQFFDGGFRMLIHREEGEGIAEWVLPVSYFAWKDEDPAARSGASWRDCPEVILTRKARVEDLIIAAEYQRRSGRDGRFYSVTFSTTNEAASQFIVLDDVKDTSRYQSADLPGFMIIESSPKNYQVWIRLNQPVNDDRRVELMQAYSPDAAAATAKRNGRMPGFRNCKISRRQPDGSCPWAKIVWVRFGVTTERVLESVAEKIERPDRPKPPAREPYPNRSTGQNSSYNSPSNNRSTNNPAYSRERFPARPILWDDYFQGDASETDFKFGLAMWNRLEREQEKSGNAGSGYGSESGGRGGGSEGQALEDLVAQAILDGRPDWTKKGGKESVTAVRYLQKTVEKIKQVARR